MKNTQKGRSMVEMLGVLAIIGVLSVGGIAGYTVAMNRYRANQILDMASKTAVIAQTLNSGAGAKACTGTGCAVADGTATGMAWTATGGVTKFVADPAPADENAAEGEVWVTITTAPATTTGVYKAIKSIVGGAYDYDDAGIIKIKTN